MRSIEELRAEGVGWCTEVEFAALLDRLGDLIEEATRERENTVAMCTQLEEERGTAIAALDIICDFDYNEEDRGWQEIIAIRALKEIGAIDSGEEK